MDTLVAVDCNVTEWAVRVREDPIQLASLSPQLNFNNATLAKCFLRLGNHAETQYKSEAYWNASDKLRNLTFNVTCGDDVKHIKGFGPSICSKIDEYITTGTMARLDELN